MSDAADTSNLVAPRGCVKIDGGQIREALDAGVQLARSNGLDSPSIQDAVWELIREAVATLKSLPDRERQWLSSVSRSAWPDIPQPIRDQIAMFNARVEHNKENPGDKIDIYDRTKRNMTNGLRARRMFPERPKSSTPSAVGGGPLKHSSAISTQNARHSRIRRSDNGQSVA